MIFVYDPDYREVRSWTHGEIEGLCFIVTITCMRTGQRNRAAVIECAYELRHYLLVVKDVVIEQVQMMCPPTISGRHEWMLEKLESIVMFEGAATEDSAVVYRTAVASYKVGDLDLRFRKRSRVLYSSKSLHSHIPSYGPNDNNKRAANLYGPLWQK